MVINCSGERSFSRFKRIKNELKGHNVPGEVARTKVTNLGKQIVMNSKAILLCRRQDKTFLTVYCVMFSLYLIR